MGGGVKVGVASATYPSKVGNHGPAARHPHGDSDRRIARPWSERVGTGTTHNVVLRRCAGPAGRVHCHKDQTGGPLLEHRHNTLRGKTAPIAAYDREDPGIPPGKVPNMCLPE